MKLFSKSTKPQPAQFSNRVKEIISQSREVAIDRQNTFIDNDHFLLAMMYDEEMTLAKEYLTALESRAAIEEYLLNNLTRYRTISSSRMIPLTLAAETALKNIDREVNPKDVDVPMIDSSHLLLSMLRDRKYPFATLDYESVKHHFDRKD